MIRLPSDGWARAAVPVMDCGHPLAARRVAWSETGKRLITDCWACAVEAEPKNRPGWPAKNRDSAA